MLKFVFIYIYFVPASGVDVLSLTYAMCGARTGITQVHVLCLITTNFVAVAVPQLAEVEQILNLHLIWCIVCRSCKLSKVCQDWCLDRVLTALMLPDHIVQKRLSQTV